MTTEDRDEKEGMDPEGDAALWTLLGRPDAPGKVSPYFSRRVLREVALAGETRAVGRSAWWRRIVPPALRSRRTALWSGALSGACAVGLFCLTLATEAPKSFPTPQGAAPGATGTPAEAVQTLVEAEAAGVAMTDDEVGPVQEREVIADLDNAVQREESRLWTDENSTARF